MKRATKKSQERRNELKIGSKPLRNSNSSSMIFLNSYGGQRPQKSDELKREMPIDREKKIWTIRKEKYECKEVF